MARASRNSVALSCKADKHFARLILGLVRRIFRKGNTCSNEEEEGVRRASCRVNNKAQVGRPCETVNTAVLTTPIRVNRPVKSQIRRAVVSDRGFGLFKRQMGYKSGAFFEHIPAVMCLNSFNLFKSPTGIADSTSGAATVGVYGERGIVLHD